MLKEAFLELIDDRACAEYAAGFDAATQRCAGTADVAGVCHGDSGGPLTALDAAGRRTSGG